MWGDSGVIIGLQKKIKKYKEIVKKLLNKERLAEEDKDFLDKEGLLND